MEPENRPNAALINKEWYESAASVLEGRKLAILVLYAVQYVLYGILPETEDQVIKVVFTMIKPALDSDIAKYRERCVRNAENAKRGRERVVASGTQSQQVVANTTPTSTPTSTTTSTPTLSLSDEQQRKRDRFEIFGYFWSIGSSSPMQEMEAFWDYYESLGWKNNKGAVIVSKIAAARMWRRQFETKTPPDGSIAWFKAVKECSIIDPNAFFCFGGSERYEDKVIVHLKCSEYFLKQLQEATPRLEADLKAFWRGLEVVLEPAG